MIASGDELLHLGNYVKLRVLILTGCPYAEEQGDKLKNEILIMLGPQLKQLKTVNEDEITEEDIQAANEERKERAKAKQEAEEAAALAAAEKAAEEAAAAAAAKDGAGEAEAEEQ